MIEDPRRLLLQSVAFARTDGVRIAAPRPKITPEMRAQLEARRDFLMAEMEKAKAAKAERVFQTMNAAEIKRERKRAKLRKDNNHA